MSDLHAAIMNLPGNPLWDGDDLRMYREGHRDARHAAAELVNEFAASHQRLKEALGKTTLLLAPANEHCSQAYLFNQMAEAFAVCEDALKDAQ